MYLNVYLPQLQPISDGFVADLERYAAVQKV
jgi:hypothetical protein